MHTLPTEFLMSLARAHAFIESPLPLDLAVELMDRGYIVEDLERTWQAESLQQQQS